jgi:gliding motility-associated-like protein
MDFDYSSIFFEENAIHYQIVDAPPHTHNQTVKEVEIVGHIFRIEFEGSKPNPIIQAKGRANYYHNYYLGKDRSKWKSGVQPYQEIEYQELYPHINLHYYRQDQQLKYDLILNPNADPTDIRLKVDGADKVQIKRGELRIQYRFGELSEMKPYAYQIVNGEAKEIECQFIMYDDKTFGFGLLGNYDPSQPVVIDPAVVFSTYSGSVGNNFGMTATYDGAGNGYMGGTIFSNNYNNTSLGYQPNYASGSADITISKFSSDGSSMLFSTFLGGNQAEAVNSMVVNSRQELTILGVSSSTNYPTSLGALKPIKDNSSPIGLGGYLQNYISGPDIVLSQFSSNGRQLISSTYYGGNESDGLNFDPNNVGSTNLNLVYNYGDHFRGEITVGLNDTIYVGTSTHSTDIDTSLSSFGGRQDGIVAKFSPDLSQNYWSRYIGGPLLDAIYSIKVSNRNQIVIGGGTRSTTGFINTSGAHQPSNNGGRSDGFVALLNTQGSVLHTTYLGTSSYDQVYFVESDRDNSFYALGQSRNLNFPLLNTNIADTAAGQFIVKFDSTLSQIEFSHTFGNGNVNSLGLSNINISPTAFLVDRCKNIYVSGWGGNIVGSGLSSMRNNMPISPNASDPITDNNDFYLYVVNNELDSLIYGSFLGGGSSEDHVDGGTSRFSKDGIIFQSVCASCFFTGSDFPTTPGSAFPQKGSNTGICNNALYKYDFEILPIASFTVDTSSFCLGPTDSVVVRVTDQSQRANRIFWDFYGTIVPGGFIDTTIVIDSPGVYRITQIVEDTVCATDGFATQTIEAFPDDISLDPVRDTLICYSDSAVLDANDNGNANTFDWSKDPFFNNVFATTDTSVIKVGLQAGIDTFYVMAGNTITNACEKVDTIIVEYIPVSYQTNLSDDTICEGSDVQLTASVSNVDLYIWDFDNGVRDSSNLNPNLTYTIPGSYDIRFIVNNNRCLSSDTTILPLEVLDNDIVLDLIPDTLACRADSISLFQNANGSISSYIWSSDSGFSDTLNQFPLSNQLIIDQIGIDTFFVKVSNAFCERTDEVEVEIVPFELELDPLPDSVCTPFTQALSTTIIGADSFRINYGNGLSTTTDPNPVLDFNVQGNYSIQLLAYNARCDIADTINEEIAVLQGVDLSLLKDTVICRGNSIDLSILHNQTAVQFFWSEDSSFNNPLNNINDSLITVSPSDSTVYYYRAVNQICEAESSILVGVDDLDIDLIDFSSICLDDTITIIADPISSFSPFQYDWSPSSEILSGQGTNTIQVSPRNDQRYLLTVTDNIRCEDTASSLVEVNIPRFDTAQIFSNLDTIYKGQSVQLSQNRQENNLVFQWEPAIYLNDPLSPNPIATPPVSTTFTLTITDQETGCVVTTSKRIGVTEINCAEPNIFIPSAFTPNNDGNNDVVYVRGEVLSDIDLSIYNRWGELVFRTQDQNKGWDGTLGGRAVDPGVFVYHLKATCFDGQQFFSKGNITLIR